MVQFDILEHSYLDLYATGDDLPETILDFSRQFNDLYNSLFNVVQPTTILVDEINVMRKRYLELIIASYEK